MNVLHADIKLRAVVALVAVTLSVGACTSQSRGLGGAALPQEAVASADATSPVDGPALPGDLSATDALSVTPPITVPYRSNDDAASRVVNPWQGMLDEATASAVASTGDLGADTGAASSAADATPADAATGIDAAASGSADIAAAGDGPISRSILPTKGSPDACKAMLKPFADALAAGKLVDVSLTTVMADGKYVSRATGGVSRQTRLSAPGQPARFTLDSTVEQLFSDRSYDRPRVLPPGVTKCLLPCTMPQAFDAAKSDRVSLQVDGMTGETTLILRSWGDSTLRLTPNCESSMLWGYGGGTFYVMTLQIVKDVKRQ